MASRRTFCKGVGASAGLVITGQSTRRVRANDDLVQEPVRRKIIGNFVTFYQLIPDTSRERYAGVWEASKEIIDSTESVISMLPAIEEIVDLEDFGEPIAGVLRNLIENLEATYDIQVDTKHLDKAVRITGYLPLLVQIWNLIQSSLDVVNTADTKQQFIRRARWTDGGGAAVEQFYIAVLLLLTELVFIGSNVAYRTAWKTTRSAANFGLVRLRGRVGLRGYSVLLSVVHWLIRGSLETTTSYIVEKTGEIAQAHSISSIEFSVISEKDISEALPQQSSESHFDFGFLGDIFSNHQGGSTVESAIDDSVKRIIIEQYDGLGIIESKRPESDSSDWFFW